MTLGTLNAIGQADFTCPSMQQLQGQVDPNDPCQAAAVIAAGPSSTSAPGSFLQWSPTAAGSAVAPAQSSSTTAALLVGGALLVFLLLK